MKSLRLPAVNERVSDSDLGMSEKVDVKQIGSPS